MTAGMGMVVEIAGLVVVLVVVVEAFGVESVKVVGAGAFGWW